MSQKRTLREKVAQMFTFSALHWSLDNETAKIVKGLKVGGIFLGMGSLQNPEQVHRLTTDLQNAALEDPDGIPLFISADFVAGAGCKLKYGATHFPKNRALGAAGNEELAYAAGRVTAVESLALGVNFNYSPVADINNNPKNPVIGTHSFGADRELVARLACAVIRGYQEHGLIATAKHFPGHGDTHVDSHFDLPVLDFSRERMESFEFVPFIRAIEAGVDAIMVGHIAAPELDASMVPASLSYTINTTILREQLGFKGLIVTDGLTMKGVTKQYTLEAACVKAIQAGADILLGTVDSYHKGKAMLDAVIAAVESGVIPQQRIEESYHRIITIKQKYHLTRGAIHTKQPPLSILESKASREVDMQLARMAVTPLHGLKEGILAALSSEELWVMVRDEATFVFAKELKQRGIPFEEKVAATYEDVLPLLEELPEDYHVLLVLSHNKVMYPQFLDRLSDQLSSKASVIWVHFGSEYDVFDRSAPCLLMYDRSPSLQRAAAEFLTGACHHPNIVE